MAPAADNPAAEENLVRRLLRRQSRRPPASDSLPTETGTPEPSVIIHSPGRRPRPRGRSADCVADTKPLLSGRALGQPLLPQLNTLRHEHPQPEVAQCTQGERPPYFFIEGQHATMPARWGSTLSATNKLHPPQIVGYALCAVDPLHGDRLGQTMKATLPSDLTGQPLEVFPTTLAVMPSSHERRGTGPASGGVTRHGGGQRHQGNSNIRSPLGLPNRSQPIQRIELRSLERYRRLDHQVLDPSITVLVKGK